MSAEEKVLVIIPYYWGKGDTVEEAVKEIEKVGGHYRKSESAHYLVGPDAFVNDMGSIIYDPDIREVEQIYKGSKLKD